MQPAFFPVFHASHGAAVRACPQHVGLPLSSPVPSFTSVAPPRTAHLTPPTPGSSRPHRRSTLLPICVATRPTRRTPTAHCATLRQWDATVSALPTRPLAPRQPRKTRTTVHAAALVPNLHLRRLCCHHLPSRLKPKTATPSSFLAPQHTHAPLHLLYLRPCHVVDVAPEIPSVSRHLQFVASINASSQLVVPLVSPHVGEHIPNLQAKLPRL